MIEEDGVDHLTGVRQQAEADVRDSEQDARVGEGLLDGADPLDRRRRGAPVVLVSRPRREDERVEEDVAAADPVLLRQQLVRPLGDGELALRRDGHRLLLVLVDASDHDGGAVVADQRADALEALLAVLEVDRIDDALALGELERRLDRPRVGRVDHQRDLDLLDEEADELVVGGLLVSALRVLQVDVEDLGAPLDLLAPQLGALLVLPRADEVLELAAPVDVGPLADDDGAVVLFDGEEVDPAHPEAPLGLRLPGRLPLGHLGEELDVLRRGPAAAPDDVEPAARREALELLGNEVRRLVELAVLIGEPGIRVAREERRGNLRERADVGGHELGPRGAVQPDGDRIKVLDARVEGLDALPGEHGAHGLDGARQHHGEARARLGEVPAHGEAGGLGVHRVERGLDEQDVGAAVDEAADLLTVGGDELVEGDSAHDGEGLGRGADGARDEARTVARGEVGGGGLGNAGGGDVDVVGAVGEAVLGEDEGGASEGVGLHDVGAGGEEPLVDASDDVGAGEVEGLVAPLVRLASEVAGGQAERVDRGPHAAVEQEDAGAEEVDELGGLSARRGDGGDGLWQGVWHSAVPG